jgi:hypothetical protein
VLGGSCTSTSAIHGFIDRRGRIVDLDGLIPANMGYVITGADDINDRGQIVAWGCETTALSVHVALRMNPTRSAR